MALERLSSSALARKTGVHATNIKRIRNNEQANPTVTTLLPLARYFSISLSQLIGDEVLPSKSAQTAAIPPAFAFSIPRSEYQVLGMMMQYKVELSI